MQIEFGNLTQGDKREYYQHDENSSVVSIAAAD
jgi:hypothetical protein